MVLDILQQTPLIKVTGFIDDNQELVAKVIHGVPVIGNTNSLPQLVEEHGIEGAIIAVGNQRIRAQLFGTTKATGLKLINAIHPSAIIANTVRIGEGVTIAAGAVINTDTRIGDDVIVNTRASIDHDNIIGDHVNIQPGVSLGGLVTVKACSEIGIGATVIQNINIGESSTVAAGAVVITDVPDRVTVAGVPAKIIKVNTE